VDHHRADPLDQTTVDRAVLDVPPVLDLSVLVGIVNGAYAFRNALAVGERGCFAR
jgi:hypothetical protein